MEFPAEDTYPFISMHRYMAPLILFTDDFQLAHGLIQRVIHSASVIKVELEEKLLDLHPYPNASASPARIHWFLLDNYIIDLTTLGIKKLKIQSA